MSNRPNTPKKPSPPQRKAPLTEPAEGEVSRKVMLIAGATTVVAAAGIGLGLFFTREGDDDAAPDVSVLTPELDFGEVTIDGENLPLVAEGSGFRLSDSIGRDVPVVSGTDYFGTPITIDPAVDGPTLIVLLAHWCPHCNNEIPRLNEWRDSGDLPEGINIVGVSTSASAQRPNFPPGEWLQTKDWQWPVLADADPSITEQSALYAYGAGGYPGFVLVDGTGVVRWRVSGEQDIADVAAVVDGLLAEEAERVAATTAAPGTTAAESTVPETTTAESTVAETTTPETTTPETTSATSAADR